jgi:predicted nucleotide-binding protein (sugar kinase/HSP70/actin superfamily)
MSTAVESNPLEGRTVYVPQMSYAAGRTLAASVRSLGVQASVSPDSDETTYVLGGKYTSGEECLPQKVTLGDFVKVLEAPDFRPERTAFLMPTSNGPCRFGMYSPHLRQLLDSQGNQDVVIWSPSSEDGYEGFGEQGGSFFRTSWRGMVAGDALTKALLQTRPYETTPGDADEVFQAQVAALCGVLESTHESTESQMDLLVATLRSASAAFRAVPADYSEPRPLIGIVGEIFCRLNDFSNNSIVRQIEVQGGEAWMSDVIEWVLKTNTDQLINLKEDGHGLLSQKGAVARIKQMFQRHDEHQLCGAFMPDFVGYEEPADTQVLYDFSEPYLSASGCNGEMTLSVGKVCYLHGKGADGIIDISPFTCMNGIVCESVYPQVSTDYDGIPIKVFYFDGTQGDLGSDVSIFMELARTYGRRKAIQRKLPPHFGRG